LAAYRFTPRPMVTHPTGNWSWTASLQDGQYLTDESYGLSFMGGAGPVLAVPRLEGLPSAWGGQWDSFGEDSVSYSGHGTAGVRLRF
jgi:hypothetical protein